MALSDNEYKVINLTDKLPKPAEADNLLAAYTKEGWDVQQIFNRTVGTASDQVYALLRRDRENNPKVRKVSPNLE